MTEAPNNQTLTPAAYVIEKLGGLTGTARKLGLAVSTVQGWQIRKRVPQKHWHAAIEAARCNGVTLELSDFLKNHERQGEAA